MKIRGDPAKQRFPSLKGEYIVDTFRGVLRIRKWPRKRGTSKSQAVRDQNKWFKTCNDLAKHCAASQQTAAIRATLRTGLYPRDLLLKQMSGGIFDLVMEDGRVLTSRRAGVTPVTFEGFMLRLTADQNIGAGGENTPNWPLPVFDTAGFWDPLNPKVITIPADINTMIMFCGCQSVGTVTGQMMTGIIGGSTVRTARQDTGLTAERGNQAVSPPIPVLMGEVYQPVFFLQTNGVVSGNGSTFFGGIILGAT